MSCPYCSATQLIVIDPETAGELVEDCEICCRPWLLRVERDPEGDLFVDVSRVQ